MRGNSNFLHQSRVHEEGLVSHDNSMDEKLSRRLTDWLCFPEIKIAKRVPFETARRSFYFECESDGYSLAQISCEKPEEITRST
jgi:hypothetical protein